MAAASENSSLSFLLLLLTQPWPVLEPIRLAAAPHFQLFLQASKLISVIKSGHLRQQLGAGKDSQGFEACQVSIEWSAASPCGTHPGLEDGCLRLPGPPQASPGQRRPWLARCRCGEQPYVQDGSCSPLTRSASVLLECRGNGFISAWFSLTSGKGIFTGGCRITSERTNNRHADCSVCWRSHQAGCSQSL